MGSSSNNSLSDTSSFLSSQMGGSGIGKTTGSFVNQGVKGAQDLTNTVLDTASNIRVPRTHKYIYI